MKVRGKKLTRKQKEALSAQGWDFRLYLCVRDGPDFMELVNRTTGKYIMKRCSAWAGKPVTAMSWSA